MATLELDRKIFDDMIEYYELGELFECGDWITFTNKIFKSLEESGETIVKVVDKGSN